MLDDSHLWAKVWGSQLQPKLKFFLWKIIHNILPTHEILITRQLPIAATCHVCGFNTETIHHLFSHCTIATKPASSLYSIITPSDILQATI
ncbi:hypothetical protein LINGRAHAP2_LOCUS14426 [Linum grandiflorum]